MDERLCKYCKFGEGMINTITKYTYKLPTNNTLSNEEENNIPRNIKAIPLEKTKYLGPVYIKRTCPGLWFWHNKEVDIQAKCVNDILLALKGGVSFKGE